MELSKYQKQIIDWLLNGKGNACCNAVAGSGKSTTLRLAAQALKDAGVSPANIKIIVFGKANSQDLIAKFGPAWKNSICTLHSAGYSLIKKELDIRNPRDAKINIDKYRKIAQGLNLVAYRIKKQMRQGTLRRTRAIAHDSDFIDIVHKVRMTNQKPTPEIVEDLCAHFEITDIFKFDVVASAVQKCLRQGEEQAINNSIFDFTDQIWLPVKWNVEDSPWFKPYKFVLVDECQDLNAAQLKLALMLAGSTGRMLFVGDPRQAIMGFAGADCDSYYKIVEETKAIELPLSLCYRCPKTHVALVNKIFPEIPIEAHPNAKTGTILEARENDLAQYLEPDDLILSRKTNPLVVLCIQLLAQGMSAKIKGRDIGKIIKNELEEIARIPGFDYQEFNDFFNMYTDAKIGRLKGMDNSEKLIEDTRDRLSALHTIYTSRPEANSINDLIISIDELFSDENSSIILSTCHRAKGLEANRVFILNPGDMPMTWENQLDWQETQEHNLLYVALTRSKQDLFIIRAETVKDGDIYWFNFSEDVSEEPITVFSEDVSESPSEEPITVFSEDVSESRSEEPLRSSTLSFRNYIAVKIRKLNENTKQELLESVKKLHQRIQEQSSRQAGEKTTKPN
ncbi:UvrD-helicase domain-containing protein [Gloeothece verrucosa]|uniref:DNA 3'-5' helicase n=1 Tax=Gloeothece verrucosa (strain PCC 7822) TaxID=497965 RepID=E0UD15_GLOV7|nr:ATP-dependent helicase [Gloeothece verrucosa]ADN16480.1 UvrD/REP helicase [Gloeothece verrucosa PCC 7822]